MERPIHTRSVKRKVQAGVVAFLCVALLSNGGCTAALWRSVDPEKPVWMPCSRITEEELQAHGRKYKKSRLMRAEPVDGYFVEKTDLEKFRDGVVLVAATPFTVVADGVLFCSCLVVAGALDNPSGLGELLYDLAH